MGCGREVILAVYDSPVFHGRLGSLHGCPLFLGVGAYVVARRSIVYIDGLNLDHGVLRGTTDRWLDLERLFTRLRPDDELELIRYFTARVMGAHRSPQESYLRALATLPLVEVCFGKFKSKRVKCGVAACGFSGARWYRVPEEKRTDVSIAVTMLEDAVLSRCDRMILVSGDSDLVPGVATVKALFPSIEVIVYVPTRSPVRGAAVELRSSADKARSLPLGLLKHSQFPTIVNDGRGGMIRRPESW